MNSISGASAGEDLPYESLDQWDLVEDLHEHDQPAIHQSPSDDVVQIRNGDIVIAILGPSGSGKSEFINTVAGRIVAPIGAALESCTQEVRAYKCDHPEGGRSVILVDTPGLDDSERTDFAVLEAVAGWLHKTYMQKILLSGILHLHNISDRRMRGPQLRGLHTLSELCGPDAKTNLVMLTTFWDLVGGQLAANREAELKDKFWQQDFLTDGASVHRLQPRTQARAWEIVDLFQAGARVSPKPLKIQIEMGDKRKLFWETSVFQWLLWHWTNMIHSIWGVGQSPATPSSMSGRVRKPMRIFGQASSENVTHLSTDLAQATKQQGELVQAIPEGRRQEFHSVSSRRRHSLWSGLSPKRATI